MKGTEMKKPALLHGGDLYGAAADSAFSQEELLDFSANINPFGMPGEVREAVLREFSHALNYPDPLNRRLREALSGAEGIPADWILCGNGGADLIYRLVYAGRPKKALVTAPSFLEYQEALLQTGTEISYYRCSTDLAICEDLLEQLTETLDLLFLCNPNNPTGLLTDRTLLLKIVEKAKENGTLVLLDECFLDFCREEASYTLKGVLGAYENLIILKSFTKMYAIPGVRLGYVLSSNPGLLEAMRLSGQPWAVSTLAESAGVAAVTQKAERGGAFERKTITYIEEERSRMKREMEALGLRVWPGEANYLLFQAAGESRAYEKLLAEGIVIRRCSNYEGLTETHYRVAVKKREENDRLLHAMKGVFTCRQKQL